MKLVISFQQNFYLVKVNSNGAIFTKIEAKVLFMAKIFT